MECDLKNVTLGGMHNVTEPLAIKKAEFIKLMKDLGAHSLYYPKDIARDLTGCGLSTVVAPDGQGVIVEGRLICVSAPEWGDPGVSPISVLATVYELATGEPPQSSMSGRGFWFNDVAGKLERHWVLGK